MPDDKRKFADDTEKLIGSLAPGARIPSKKASDKVTGKRKAIATRGDRPASRAKETTAAKQLLKAHAARRAKR
jgi:hypothetical protein